MNCEELQLNISVYADDAINEKDRADVDNHLVSCPLCRQKLADFQLIKNNLRTLARPEMPSELLSSIRSRVRQEVSPAYFEPLFLFRESFFGRLKMNLVPYGFGAALSLLFCSALLLSLVSTANNIETNTTFAANESDNKQNILLAEATPRENFDDFYISSKEFASNRLAVSSESPSVNPNGALIALTKSLVRGEMKDEEVVVVADVFGNGLARIDEVIEPSSNRRAVVELQKALQSDPAYAPFVPAKMDGRSDNVRIILKFQTVNVVSNPN